MGESMSGPLVGLLSVDAPQADFPGTMYEPSKDRGLEAASVLSVTCLSPSFIVATEMQATSGLGSRRRSAAEKWQSGPGHGHPIKSDKHAALRWPSLGCHTHKVSRRRQRDGVEHGEA